MHLALLVTRAATLALLAPAVACDGHAGGDVGQDAGPLGGDSGAPDGAPVVCDPAPTTNLAPNPGFETPEPSWLFPEDPRAEIAIISHDGATAVRVEHQGGASWEARTADAVPVGPGRKLRFSARVASVGLQGSARFVVDEVDGDGQVVASQATTAATGTAPSSERSLDFVTTPATEKVRLSIAVSADPSSDLSGTTVYDGISLRADPPPSLVVNPSFEGGLDGWGWHATAGPYPAHDTQVFRGAPGSLRLDPAPPGVTREAWNTNFPVAAGQVVEASVWSRTDPGGPFEWWSGSLVNVDFRAAGQLGIRRTGNAGLVPWGTADWSLTRLLAVAGPGDNLVIVALSAYPEDHPGSAWFDDVVVTLPDLAPNPGFDYFRPVGWDFSGVSSGVHNMYSTSSLDAATRRCGRVALRVDHHGVRSHFGYLLESASGNVFALGIPATAIKVTPGVRLRLQGYVRTHELSAGTGLELAEYDAAGNDLGPPRYEPHNATSTVSGTVDWTLLSRQVTLSPATEHALVRIRVAVDDEPITGTAWYDDIWLVIE